MIFTPPTLADTPPIAYRDRSARQDGTVTNEWSVRDVNPRGFRLMSFFAPRQQGVAIYKMDDGTYCSDRPVPGVVEQTAWPPVPLSQQVNGAINQSWLYSHMESEQTQSPAVVFVYYGGTSYQVDAAEAAALTAAGFGDYLKGGP